MYTKIEYSIYPWMSHKKNPYAVPKIYHVFDVDLNIYLH